MKCKRVVLGWVFLAGIVLGGCGPKLPDGLNDLQSCSLTLTSQRKPLTEAAVSLIPHPAGSNQWIAGGMSNAEGRVEFFVQGKYKGVPSGKYKVVVVKNLFEVDQAEADRIRSRNARSTGDAVERLIEAEIRKKATKIIPLVHRDCTTAGTTPLEIEIVKGRNKITLDVPGP